MCTIQRNFQFTNFGAVYGDIFIRNVFVLKSYRSSSLYIYSRHFPGWRMLIELSIWCMRHQVQLPVPKFKKGLGTSVHIVKITFYQKITQPPEISFKN